MDSKTCPVINTLFSTPHHGESLHVAQPGGPFEGSHRWSAISTKRKNPVLLPPGETIRKNKTFLFAEKHFKIAWEFDFENGIRKEYPTHGLALTLTHAVTPEFSLLPISSLLPKRNRAFCLPSYVVGFVRPPPHPASTF